MLKCERAGCWPDAVGVVIIVLLAKPDGGWRPIGLLPHLVRVWMRVRRDVATEWEASCSRNYLYAGVGKGSTVAAWKQAARAEIAAALQTGALERGCASKLAGRWDVDTNAPNESAPEQNRITVLRTPRPPALGTLISRQRSQTAY